MENSSFNLAAFIINNQIGQTYSDLPRELIGWGEESPLARHYAANPAAASHWLQGIAERGGSADLLARFKGLGKEIARDGLMAVTNCGGPGSSDRGPFSSHREVRLDDARFWAALGLFGPERAKRAWSEIEEALRQPPKVFEERLVTEGVTFDQLSWSNCDPEYLEKNQEWMRGFLARIAENRLGEVHYFAEHEDWYSLIGYQSEIGTWDLIPVPVFWGIWPKIVHPVDKMGWNATGYIMTAFSVITPDHRSNLEWVRHEHALAHESFRPIQDGKGLLRFEEARRSFGCAVTVTPERLTEIIRLPWKKQVATYMAAIQAAHDTYVATTDDECICPNLPVRGKGKRGKFTIHYVTSTGNTHLVVSGGTFRAYRRNGEALSVTYPDLYEAAGGQLYPGYPSLRSERQIFSSVGGHFVRLIDEESE